MDNPRLATWKYRHDHPDGPSAREAARTAGVVAGTGVLAAVLVAAALLAGAPAPVPVAVVLVALVAVILTLRGARRPRVIAVGPRYLVCGSEIVYFANVTGAVLDTGGGRLRLTTVSGRTFVLEQRRFPTGARKPHKIAANTAAKFGRVGDRILGAVQRAAPGAVITRGRV